ncbi:MAG: Hdr-like menaquinol oxidoreductase cytochrome c subunit [Betaproteobacteria bacterium]|nr:MAG: Hdr-like menaquinol oxidoreductase cytochrome c subunit [Betaproteobacteria bacterium]
MKVFAALLALAAVLAAGLAFAAGRTAKPVVLIERPGQCVEATEVMRRDHMKLLLHQRDRTVRDGIRTKPQSLAGCVDCHASRKTGSVLGEQGFCQSCHAYAGVRLDCWECHTPKARAQAAGAKP